MKPRSLSLLCAVACASFAGPAVAQVGSVPAAAALVNDANANGRVLFISGTGVRMEQAARALFASGTTYSFQPSAASGRSSADYRASAGRLATSVGGWPAGTAVIVVKRDRGGSFFGMNPVARNESIESLVVSVASCVAGSGTPSVPFLCNNLENRTPDAGVTELAPKLYDDIYNTPGEPAEPKLSPAELSTLTSQPVFGSPSGFALTDNLPLLFISKPMVTSLLAGNIATWDGLDATQPADDVLICRRTNGSSTQAVANLYFNDYPCASPIPVADRDSVPTFDAVARTFVVEGATGGLNVIENASSGDVRTCMNISVDASNASFDSAATPGNFTINPATNVGTWSGTVGYSTYVTADRAGNPVGVALRNGRAHKAIGHLGLDSLGQSTPTSRWTFRTLDGAGELFSGEVLNGTGRAPTRLNYLNGAWDMQAWAFFNIPSRTTGNKRALANAILREAKAPTNLPAGASALCGVPDPTGTGNVLKVYYQNNDQCRPLLFAAPGTC